MIVYLTFLDKLHIIEEHHDDEVTAVAAMKDRTGCKVNRNNGVPLDLPKNWIVV